MQQLIHNAHVLTMNSSLDEFLPGCVALDGPNIVDVGGPSLVDRYPDFERIDARGGLLIPGLINAHTHIGMIPFRSLGDDCPDRLRKLLIPLETVMTEELAAASARYACCEMLLSGTTTLVDMYYFEDALATVVKESGMRALLGETVVDFPTCDSPVPHGGLSYAERFISRWKGDERITPMVAPHAPNTNSPEAIVAAHRLSELHQLPWTMHVAEMDYEMAFFRERYGMSPIAFLDSLGVLGPRFIAAHGIHADAADLEILARRGVTVAHCIGANTKSGKGVAPIKQMLDAGVRVALGTDGPASGNTLDLFTQMDLFAKFHKTAHRDRSLFPASQIVGLATRDAAQALGLGALVGTIEIGKRADLTLVETQSVNMFPRFDPYSALVYSAKASNVDTVLVDGRVLVRGKQLVAQDLGQVRSHLDGLMDRFRSAAAHLSRALDS